MRPLALELDKWLQQVLNNLYEVENKLSRAGDPANALRNVARMKDALATINVFYEDPFGQSFVETRTDLEVTVSGTGTENLRVVEVIKPIIRIGDGIYSRVAQKGIVVVQSVSIDGPSPTTTRRNRSDETAELPDSVNNVWEA